MDSCAVSKRSISSLPAELLTNILRFLPARSLINTVLVSHLWKDLAERELTRRKRFISRMFQCSKSTRRLGVMGVIADIQRQILSFLNKIDIVPSAMVISSSGLFAKAKRLTSIKDFSVKISAKLPKDCVVIGALKAGGMVGQTNSGQPVELKGHHKQLSILFIPKVKGVNVSLFKITKADMEKGIDSKENWRRQFDHLVDKNIKFMLLIAGEQTLNEYVDDISVCTNQVLGEQVVVYGGKATPFAVVNNEAVSSEVMGMAIGGNVYAASQVVRDDLTFGHEIDAITPLGPNEPTFARLPTACFVVTCVGIGSPFDNNGNLKGFRFKQQCPEFTVFGFFGYGEIGPSDTKASTFVMHQYSNVYAILVLL